jgi:hypothetical protein
MGHHFFTQRFDKRLLSILWATSSFIALNAVATERPSTSSPIVKYESAKTRSSGKMNRATALKALRGQKAISHEDYRHVKGASASQAALVTSFHAKGIKGEGVKIWLLEDSGVNAHPEVLKYIDSSSDMASAAGFSQKQDHGAAMASLAHQIAPKASLSLKHLAGYAEAFHRESEKPFIINASFNTGDVDINSYFGPIFTDRAFQPLVVKSAGNDGTILSEDRKYKDLSPDLMKHLIIAGNLRQDGRPRASSSVPGDDKAIQDRFLWVIADDMLAAGGPTGTDTYRYITGTSGAAAILSGAAALIKGRYPSFTMEEVAECLLESANRDLFGLFGDGYHALHVINGPSQILREPVRSEDEGQAGAGSSSASPSRIQIRTIMYEPAQWGKGVLNVKNAMFYASLKSQLPHEKPEGLRRRMLGSIALHENLTARKIQKWWRTNKKSIPEVEKPLPLVVDESIPDRTYPEAEGEYGGKFIEEPDPKEAGRKQGLSYEERDDTHHKTPAEIRAERERLKASTKGIVEQLKEGLTTLDAIKEDLKKKTPEELVEWFYTHKDILDYKISEQPFLFYVLPSYDWNIRDALLQGLNETFSEQYKGLIGAVIQVLGGSEYLYFSVPGSLKKFVEECMIHKAWFNKEEIGRLLLFVLQTDGENAEYYVKCFKENRLDPLSTTSSDNSTIMHLIGRNPDVFKKTLDYYMGQGVSGGALLNAQNARGATPFGMVAEKLGFSEKRDISDDLISYIHKGGRFLKGMYQESSQMTDLSIFIKQSQPTQDDQYEGQWNIVSFEGIKKSFLSLKDRAFIFDIEGIDKDLGSFSVYGIPDSVSGLMKGECSSSADWRAKVDRAWAQFERFLKTGHGKVYKNWDGQEKPLMVTSEGKIFYNTEYYNWPKE